MTTCDHMIDRRCTSPQGSALWGQNPAPGICAIKCTFYSGPPRDPAAAFTALTTSASRAVVRKQQSYRKMVSEFLLAWNRLIREGAVTMAVAMQRSRQCMACPACVLAADGATRMCSACGCGERQYGMLFREGEPGGLDGATFPRLFMPDPRCPRKDGDPMRLAPSPGSGSLDAVGGLHHQRRMLARAVAAEVGRGFRSAWRTLSGRKPVPAVTATVTD